MCLYIYFKIKDMLARLKKLVTRLTYLCEMSRRDKAKETGSRLVAAREQGRSRGGVG